MSLSSLEISSGSFDLAFTTRSIVAVHALREIPRSNNKLLIFIVLLDWYLCRNVKRSVRTGVLRNCISHALTTDAEEIMGLLLGDTHILEDGSTVSKIWRSIPQVRNDRRKVRPFRMYSILAPRINASLYLYLNAQVVRLAFGLCTCSLCEEAVLQA